ncbi:hypothetical protein L6164_032197 [Bauhinia variegata]|uniref:Uncharacterized protein n=1 Tax=Bauhinia variegata TaxID=167791 RepID=A0ACB9KN20_BAUVA|nr:hypothetical protein L6164_032197 [Bauhinia variegata]
MLINASKTLINTNEDSHLSNLFVRISWSTRSFIYIKQEVHLYIDLKSLLTVISPNICAGSILLILAVENCWNQTWQYFFLGSFNSDQTGKVDQKFCEHFSRKM